MCVEGYRMKKSLTVLPLFSALFLLILQVSAQGIGTSNIILSQSSLNVTAGNSVSVDYTVQLASGSTWGTTLVVTNAAQLQQQGITVSLSNPSGEPPFSGVLTVITSQTTTTGSRIYTVILAATGDDPSQQNAVLNVNVASPSSAGSSTVATTATQYPYPTSGIGIGAVAGVLIAIIALATAYLMFVWKSMLTRLVFMGTAMILIGTVVWLYGDYAGGLFSYIYGGVAAILIGTSVWFYGDIKGGTFKQKLPGKLVAASILVMLIGIAVWIYGDYNGGLPLYIWGGTALLLLGTIIWLYADLKAGAFLRRKK